jgi:hypothetical protein
MTDRHAQILAAWRLRIESPAEFQAAATFEHDLQDLHRSIETPGKIKGIPFLHRSLTPLAEIDFDAEANRVPDQGSLSFGEECEGMCGL